MYLLHSIYSGKVNYIVRLNRIFRAIYSVPEHRNVTVTHMIRISIFFLALFTVCWPVWSQAQNGIVFQCYNLDTISWVLSVPKCSNPEIDSFQILSRTEPNSDFAIKFTSTDPSLRGYRDESLKSDDAILLRYYLKCPDNPVVNSDTLRLSSLREPVELDSVRVLANGDVQLSWKEKPIAGVRYVVNAAIGGSSQVLATNLQRTSYTDTRGQATRSFEYYSISAALDCGYTFPEPDSFFHTSLLSEPEFDCGGDIYFGFKPFSYWKDGTSSATFFVERDGVLVDSLEGPVGTDGFGYNGLKNESMYTFYVRETGKVASQVAYSNPITITTDIYEIIRWIVIDDFSFDDDNQATISWTTNNHSARKKFQLHLNADTVTIPENELIDEPQQNSHGFKLAEFPTDGKQYMISLRDSCGNEEESLAKMPLLTQGQLTSTNQLNIQWTDVADDEWTVDSYEIYYKTDGSYTLLDSENGSTFNDSYAFEESKSIDSLCYYVVAKGKIHFQEIDSIGVLSIRSNTVCLFGETTVVLPNAYSPHQAPYKPIIVPKSNLTSYVFRIFDRYGNLVFETKNPEEGWDGSYQGKQGFMDVYMVQVEFTNSRGESIVKTGSLLVLQ